VSTRGPLVVFLSTGRCGTQWLTESLRELYAGSVEVEHEPLGPLYAPRRYFRRYDDPDAVLKVPAVARHVERIARIEHYVETGWPLFPAIPMLARRFPDRLRVVHLTRHPVPTALSHLAHSSYAGSGRDDDFTRLATLAPSDPNVLHSEYAERWSDLTAYEKCLYWWTEVHSYGLELPERLPGIPFVRVKAERMLAGEEETLERLAAHLGLPPDGRLAERTGRLVDRWHHHTDRAGDPLLVRDHAATMDVAARLGYSLGELDLDALHARYAGTPDPGLDRIGRSFG
jgi:hypothetical protein